MFSFFSRQTSLWMDLKFLTVEIFYLRSNLHRHRIVETDKHLIPCEPCFELQQALQLLLPFHTRQSLLFQPNQRCHFDRSVCGNTFPTRVLTKHFLTKCILSSVSTKQLVTFRLNPSSGTKLFMVVWKRSQMVILFASGA